MSNQPKLIPKTDETDEPDEPEPAEPDYDERAPDKAGGTSTSDLPRGATDGELPPAP
jgi:hypothetical protein